MTMTSTHSVSLLSTTKTLTCLKQLHANLLKAGLDADPFVAGKLLRTATSLPYALSLFRHFLNPDAFMYNTLIRALADSDTPLHSLALFSDMRKVEAGPNPDSFTFAFSIKAAANSGCFSGGSQLHCQALAHGFNGHVFVWTTLVSMYGECGCVGYARKVFDEIPDPNVVAWNALLTALFRGRDVEGAREVFGLMPVRDSTSWNVVIAGHAREGEMGAAEMAFREMPVKDDVSWSTMIVGFARNGFFNEAFGFFRELIGEGVRPNEISLTGVLSACAQAGALDLAKVVHGLTVKLGVDWIVSVNNTLIDAYSKCGNVDMARLVFEEMPEKGNVVTWTTMLAGLAMYGHGKEALELFDQMEESGVRPDGIAFISLFYACSHAGMIEKGRMYFDKMREAYGIEPDFEHYGCMIDLYGRAGDLQKAYAFACQMPFPPNAVIWRTLLGACSIHGDVELAEKVKLKISEVDPGDSSDFVLLSNVYAASGKWKNVASMRRSMANHAMKKTPGWSMIEVDKLMYTFFAGAKQDDITDEAYEMLKEIMQRLRVEGGYVPQVGTVLYDLEEEEKEDPLNRHSEKLAVAFGILRLCKGRAIRIVKNLRICMDCHTVMKLISRIYKLEIVVRDRSRFHSFRDGSCSCNDYW